MKYSLEHVNKTYHLWGRHPFLYKLACVITFLGRENKLRAKAIEMLQIKKGETVLDLACGTSLNHKLLEDATGANGKIIAFDYSNEMLSTAKLNAKKNGWNNIIFIQGDAAQLSLDFQVDGVLSSLGISAIPQHKQALRKAHSILKENGKISILDAQLPSGLWRIFNPLISYIYKHWASWDYTKKIPKYLQQLFRDTETIQYNGGTMYITHGRK